jgi:hypothetical protein
MTEEGKNSTSEGYQCTLSPELSQKAERELNEKPEWRSRDIQALREMVNKNTGMAVQNLSKLIDNTSLRKKNITNYE